MVTGNAIRTATLAGSVMLILSLTPLAASAGEGPDQDGNDGGSGSSDQSAGDAALDGAITGAASGIGAQCCGLPGAIVGGAVGGAIASQVDLPADGDGATPSGGLDAGNPNTSTGTPPGTGGGGIGANNTVM